MTRRVGYSEFRLSSNRLITRLTASAIRTIADRPQGVLVGRKAVHEGKPVIVVRGVKAAGYQGAGIVGFYRHSSQAELALEDNILLSDNLGEGAGVFLAVAPCPDGIQGSLFYYYRGRVLAERNRVAILVPAALPGRRWVLGAATATVAAIFGLAGWRALSVEATSAEADFELAAKWSGADTVVRWNSRVLNTFRSARLTISDGDQIREYPLSRREIQDGVFSYTPRASDVKFEMQATGSDGRSIHQSLVLAGQVSVPPLVPEPKRRRPVRRAGHRRSSLWEPANALALPGQATERAWRHEGLRLENRKLRS